MAELVQIPGFSEPVSLSTALDMMYSGSVIQSSSGGFAFNDEMLTEERQARVNLLFDNFLRSSFALPFTQREGALLSFPLIRLIARRSAAIKAPVDFICRSMAGTPWRIRTIDGMRVPKKAVRRANELFIKPNSEFGMDTFQVLFSRLLRDMVEIDHGIILKHFEGGSLDAFEAMDSSTFWPIQDKNTRRLKKWTQVITDQKKEDFDLDQIVHFVMDARSDSVFGMPKIETVLQEVTATFNATRSFSKSMSEGEIPPGVLALMGVEGSRTLERMRRGVKRDAGISNDYRLQVLSGITDAKWIQFQREWREMQVAEILNRLERIIFRIFGVDRIAMGSAQDVNRSTAEAMVATRHFSLFKPILDLAADNFTYQVLQDIHPGLFIEFIHFARTGMESDLQAVPIRPTGHVEELPSSGQTGDSEKYLVVKRPCGGCDGHGQIVYNINGEYDGVECPHCVGRGVGGPLFVSRPSGFILPDAVDRVRRFNIHPSEAWQDFASVTDQETLRMESNIVAEDIVSYMQSIESQADVYRASTVISDKLCGLYEKAYEMSSEMLRAADRAPHSGQLKLAKDRIRDFVRFQVRAQAESVTSQDDAYVLSTRIQDDVQDLAGRSIEVAGRVLADSLSQDLDRIGKGRTPRKYSKSAQAG